MEPVDRAPSQSCLRSDPRPDDGPPVPRRAGCPRTGLGGLGLLGLALVIAGAVGTARAATAPPAELEIELVERTIRDRLASGLDLEARTLGFESGAVPLRDVLRIRFRSPVAGARWDVSVRLADGTRIHGALAPSDDPDRLQVEVPSLGRTLPVPLEWVREIRHGSEVAAADENSDPGTAVTNDRVETDRGSELVGVIEKIGPEGVRIEEQKLGTLDLPWSQVRSVRVAALDPNPALPEGSVAASATTDDGSRWTGALTTFDADRLTLSNPLVGTIEIPEGRRVELELMLDRVVYLSDRRPSKVEEGTPFSDYHPWTWKRDRNVLGGPLKIGRRTYRKGLGVHSRSSLEFALDEDDLVFRAEVGIDVIGRPVDDNEQVGSVRFVVLVDGEEAWRSGDHGWQDPPRPVEVPLQGNNTLTLIVEMGLGHHVLDRADWGDARILRK